MATADSKPAPKKIDWRAKYKQTQMFEYNLGRLHQAESDQKFYLRAAIAGGCCIFVSGAVKILAEAAKSARG